MTKQPEVVELAQKILKAAGKQNPATMMKALLMCMRLIDVVTPRPRKTKLGADKTEEM